MEIGCRANAQVRAFDKVTSKENSASAPTITKETVERKGELRIIRHSTQSVAGLLKAMADWFHSRKIGALASANDAEDRVRNGVAAIWPCGARSHAWRVFDQIYDRDGRPRISNAGEAIDKGEMQ